jgi:hypothetical protein
MSYGQALAYAQMLISRTFQTEHVYCLAQARAPPAPPVAAGRGPRLATLEHNGSGSVKFEELARWWKDRLSGGKGRACRSLAPPLISPGSTAQNVTLPNVLMARELFRYAMLHDCDQQDEVCMTLRTPAIDPHWAAHDTALHINPLDWRGAIDDFLRRGLGALLNLHSPDGLTFESAAPASLALPAEAPASMVHNLALYRTAYRDLSLLEAEVSS